MVIKYFLILIVSMFFVSCGGNNFHFLNEATVTGQDTDGPTGGENNDDVDDPNQDPPPVYENATDNFVQRINNNAVDILIVDDNSGSMKEEQIKMSERFGSFISGLMNVDWQIAVTTTDLTSDGLNGRIDVLDGAAPDKILTSAFMNADEIFKNTVQREETINCSNRQCASGNERPLEATIRAMERRDRENEGFFRPDTDLAVVVLSDEDEGSDRPSGSTQPKEVLQRFKEIWGTSKKLSYYGIIVEPGDDTCLQDQRQFSKAHFGTAVAELSDMTGGVTGSICDTDYSDALQSIGDNINFLIDSFQLSHVPVDGTVSVTVTPTQDVEWMVEGDKLIFTVPPTYGSDIKVDYTYEK